MSDCSYRHNDPLLAELCEQMRENGAEPGIAHEMALDMYADAQTFGYEGEL